MLENEVLPTSARVRDDGLGQSAVLALERLERLLAVVAVVNVENDKRALRSRADSDIRLGPRPPHQSSSRRLRRRSFQAVGGARVLAGRLAGGVPAGAAAVFD